MDVSDLITLYDYYYWATRKILAQAEKVTPAQWSGPPPIGDWSLRETLVHTLNAERAWRHGWAGLGLSAPLQAADSADAASLAARWREEAAAMRAYLGSLSDEDAQGAFYDEDVPDPYILWQVIAHLSYHGMQHRSEAAMLLTHFGLLAGGHRHGLLAGRTCVAGQRHFPRPERARDEHEPDIRAWLAGQRGRKNAPTARAPYRTTTDDTP